ncbi:hypothetical protein HU830_05065 [Lactobacillus sp. DCY120]|uniref:Immunity protein n=1 Tax=Bombilactobacillus apium TaxID=2675299 RepID=A0A850RB40_9LACO|nr:hypothetical protein [Bombilactobacillus apium]NVY96536.1 hypothetical protein [Bombilactobacillus apium]
MFNLLLGIFAIILGILEFINTQRYFRVLKQQQTSSSSHFSLATLYFGYFFAVVMVIMGIISFFKI